MSFSELSIRIAASFIVLLALTRIMGRKEIGQLTFFNFVSAIAIGSIAATVTTSQFISLEKGIYVLAGWALLTIIMGFIDIKSKNARKVLEGQPLIMVRQGKVMEKELRKARLDLDSLNAMLRKKNAFALTDVEYAILETDGKLSVMKKESQQPITQSAMNIQKFKTDVFPIATELIADGKINKANLSKLHLDEDWLKKQLDNAGVESVSDIFYAEIQKDGSLYIDHRNDMLH